MPLRSCPKKARADFITDLGQGSLRLNYLTKVSSLSCPQLRMSALSAPSALSLDRCNSLRRTVPLTVPDVRRFLLLLPIILFCRNPKLTPFILLMPSSLDEPVPNYNQL